MAKGMDTFVMYDLYECVAATGKQEKEKEGKWKT